MGERLIAAVGAVDWAVQLSAFEKSGFQHHIASSSLRLAIWSKHLETADKGNPALPFVREMQSQSQLTATLIALGLYKASAGSMRAVLESALYYSYFRTHSSELSTLVRDPDYFVDKKQVLQFHNTHTLGFRKKEAALGLVAGLNEWYSTLSAVIHGQLPGRWVTGQRIEHTAFHQETCTDAVNTFVNGCELVHKLLLATIDSHRWNRFPSASKVTLLKGLTPQIRTALGLRPS